MSLERILSKKELVNEVFRNVIDTIIDVDFDFCEFPLNNINKEGNIYLGLYLPKTKRPKIYILKNQERPQTRYTIIHETLYHYFYKNGYDAHTERDVERITKDIYKILYRRKP